MTGLLRGVALLWMVIVWIVGIAASGYEESYGWMILWILMPPVALLGEVLMDIAGLVLVIFGVVAPPSGGYWLFAIAFTFLLGWIPLLAYAERLDIDRSPVVFDEPNPTGSVLNLRG